MHAYYLEERNRTHSWGVTHELRFLPPMRNNVLGTNHLQGSLHIRSQFHWVGTGLLLVF